MSATHDAEDREQAIDGADREVAPPQKGAEKEPTWTDGSLGHGVVEAAKRVFNRRRELLRRLA